MVNLNMTWLGFVFVLISIIHMHGAVKIGLPRSKGKGDGKIAIFMDIICVSSLISTTRFETFTKKNMFLMKIHWRNCLPWRCIWSCFFIHYIVLYSWWRNTRLAICRWWRRMIHDIWWMNGFRILFINYCRWRFIY